MHLPLSADPLVLNEALEPLTRYSLIRRDVDADTYSMHRMMQEVVKDQMGAELQAQWAERVVRAVAQSFPEVDLPDVDTLSAIYPARAGLCRIYRSTGA